MRELISDFLRDYFAFDSKFFRTFRKLLASPGYVSRAYIQGRRVEFLPPFRLYIVVSFVFFLILSMIFQPDIRTDRAEKAAVLDSLMSDTTGPVDLEPIRHRFDHGAEEAISTGALNLQLESDTLPSGEFEYFVQERIEHVMNDPTMFRVVLFRAFSISMFVLLPVFALVLWLFHFRRQPYYAPHVIHSVHFHTLLFVLAAAVMLAAHWAPRVGLSIFARNAGLFYFLAALLYLVVSLHRVYAQSIGRSVWKAVLIAFIYLWVLAMAMLATILGSLLAM